MPLKQERKQALNVGLLRTTEMRTLGYITGDTLRDRIYNENIRNICEIQDIIRCPERRAWRDHVNRMHDTTLAKIAKNGKSNNWMASKTLLQRLDVNIPGEQVR